MEQIELVDIGKILRSSGQTLHLKQRRKTQDAHGESWRQSLHQRFLIFLGKVKRLLHENIQRRFAVLVTLKIQNSRSRPKEAKNAKVWMSEDFALNSWIAAACLCDASAA